MASTLGVNRREAHATEITRAQNQINQDNRNEDVLELSIHERNPQEEEEHFNDEEDTEALRQRRNLSSSLSTSSSTQYNIAESSNDINPWSSNYFGVLVCYFSVGIMLGGSVNILYPILIVNEGVSNSYYTASVSVVTIFWSYKIVFGIISDCFPIMGLKRKPYIIIGWLLCALILTYMASYGDEISSRQIVTILMVANLGYVMADVSADGFMVWMAQREPIERRGKMQSLVYSCNKFGQICINFVILFGFSGPHINCPGYQSNQSIPCTTDESIAERNEFYEDYPDTWCYMQCSDAAFSFGLTIPQYAWMIASVNILSIAFYFLLYEETATSKHTLSYFFNAFWSQLQRRAAWQVILYNIISSITFGVGNAAKTPANYVWLDMTTTQNQIMVIMEKIIFFVGLNVISTYALHLSWRKLIWYGSILVTVFNFLYFLIIFDIYRNPWFYIFTDVSASFMYTLNFLASYFCIVEITEPGYETITYSLITTATNTVTPLSSVISYQFLSLFPALGTQKQLEEDTPQVREQFALLHILTIIINLSSLLALPMLPRQKKETRELVAKGETSTFWGSVVLISSITFLIYATIVTFVTVLASNTLGCHKIFGGNGCTDDESSVPVYFLVFTILVYCYGINFYLSFWRQPFSLSNFI